MSRARGVLRAYLELSRISNLPTVWTNVLTGCGVGVLVREFARMIDQGLPLDSIEPTIAPIPLWPTAAMTAAGVSLLYIGGMAMNDLVDARFDHEERPDRPIPSGRITPRAATRFVVVTLVVGLILVALAGLSALMFGAWLVAMILLYDLVHKKTAWSVLIMGLCRALVYVCAAVAVAGDELFRHGLWKIAVMLGVMIGLYTAGITVIARSENDGRLDGRKWLSVLMVLLPLAAPLAALPVSPMALATQKVAGLAGLLLVVWLSYAAFQVLRSRPRTMNAVLMWLSGMCLIDAYILSTIAQPVAAVLAGVCFLLTVWGHRHILGT